MELHKQQQRHEAVGETRYRQLPCKTFISVGTCPYRERCVYLHDPRCGLNWNFSKYICYYICCIISFVFNSIYNKNKSNNNYHHSSSPFFFFFFFVCLIYVYLILSLFLILTLYFLKQSSGRRRIQEIRSWNDTFGLR